MEKKPIYIGLGVGAAVILSAGLYYIYKRLNKVTVNQWLDDYLNEIEEELKENKENPSAKFAFKILHLTTELEDYLYQQNHYDLEQERISFLENRAEYEKLFSEYIEVKEKYFKVATDYIEGRLGLSLDSVMGSLQDIEDTETKIRIYEEAKKPYNDLPKWEKEKIKESYIFHVKNLKVQNRIMHEQISIQNRNPEYESEAMRIIHQSKTYTNDVFKKKYGISPKYLNQLVQEKGLLNDPEVKMMYDECRNLQ